MLMTHVHDDPTWLKATSSSVNGSCVEVAFCACGETKMRDSKDPDGPVLTFTSDEWRAFYLGVMDGEFD